MKLVIRSIRNVFRSPIRLILVVTLLGASLMFVAAMVSLDASSQQQLTAVQKQIGTTITIQYAPQPDGEGVTNATPIPGTDPGTSIVVEAPHISNSMVAKVQHTSGVTAIQATLSRPYMEKNLSSFAARLPPITIDGISSGTSNFTVSGGAVPTLVAGRGFRDSDAHAHVAMMSQALAQKNHLQVGSTFTLNGTQFTLIGLYTTSSQITDNTIVIPLAILQQMYKLDGVDSLTVTAASHDQVEAIATRLRNLLGSQFNVTTLADHYSNVLNALQVAQNSIRAALVASFLIAAAIIIFAVLMLMRERIAEIAILKTIGASHLQVLRQFWVEILTLNTVSAALAIGLLVILGPFVSQIFAVNASSLIKPAAGGPSIDHPFVTIDGNGTTSGTTSTTASNVINAAHLTSATLNVQTLLIILGVGIGLALLTSFIPTWFVARLKPAHVLRQAN